jgi:hypothetical protein
METCVAFGELSSCDYGRDCGRRRCGSSFIGKTPAVKQKRGETADLVSHLVPEAATKTKRLELAAALVCEAKALEQANQVPAAALLTLLKVPLPVLPRVVTREMQATKIRASITPYSTAVGPSSFRMNPSTQFSILHIRIVPPTQSACNEPACFTHRNRREGSTRNSWRQDKAKSTVRGPIDFARWEQPKAPLKLGGVERPGSWFILRIDQLAVRLAFTLLNVPLTVCPRVVTTVVQATKIRASITAYSTAVGPSSLRRNLSTRFDTLRITIGP